MSFVASCVYEEKSSLTAISSPSFSSSISRIERTNSENIKPVYPFEDMVMGHIKMMESGLFGELITTPQKL